MPAPIRSLADTIGWEEARLGRSRLTQNDWAAGASVDDCALFQSTAVFGQKAAWNVDVFKTLDGGTYHDGKAGLQRGDVVLFDWNGNGIADHTELALSAPDAGGNFQTIGANGSDTIAVAYRTRNSYVLGYFRPAYPDTGDDDMTPDQANQLAQIFNAVFSGGPSMQDNGKSISQTLAELNAPVWRDINGDGTNEPILQIQDNADTNTMVRSLLATVGGMNAALSTLAASTGADPEAIKAAAKAGAEEALAGLQLVPVTKS